MSDNCTIKAHYLNRTTETLECDKCIFRGTDQCEDNDDRENLSQSA